MPKNLKRQKDKCTHCGLNFRDGDILEIDHIKPKTLGGDNSLRNQQLLHRHCDDSKTALDLLSIHDKNHVTDKPDAAKMARPVLKTSQRGDSLA